MSSRKWAVPPHRRDWLTVEEVAKQLYLSSPAIRDRIQSGRIIAHKRLGMWQITPAALEAYLSESHQS